MKYIPDFITNRDIPSTRFLKNVPDKEIDMLNNLIGKSFTPTSTDYAIFTSYSRKNATVFSESHGFTRS